MQPGTFVRMLLSAGVNDEQQADVYYLQQLIRFATLKERSLKREFIEKAFAGVPGLVIDLIVRSFTSGGDDRLSKTTNGLGDKLIVHILILALHVSKPEFVLSPEALATDLQLAPIKLVLYLREIGCRIQTMNKNGNKLYRASLQAPLKFPSAPKRRSSGPSG